MARQVGMNLKNNQETTITGQEFERPLRVNGDGITAGYERYLGHKPFELSELEFYKLKQGKLKHDVWWVGFVGSMLGLVITVISKAFLLLIDKTDHSFEPAELVALPLWIVVAWLSKRYYGRKTQDEIDFEEIKKK